MSSSISQAAAENPNLFVATTESIRRSYEGLVHKSTLNGGEIDKCFAPTSGSQAVWLKRKFAFLNALDDCTLPILRLSGAPPESGTDLSMHVHIDIEDPTHTTATFVAEYVDEDQKDCTTNEVLEHMALGDDDEVENIRLFKVPIDITQQSDDSMADSAAAEDDTSSIRSLASIREAPEE